MAERFKGKTVIVTGAGKGIGHTTAVRFAEEGGNVVIADIDQSAGEGTLKAITDAGGKAIFVQGDIADEGYVKQLIAEAVSAFGGVDVLYNNAGVVKYGTVVDMPVEDWDWIIGINLRASYLTCKYAIPEMRKRGGGAIVNTASVQAFASQQTVAAYSASKGAIVSFTTTVALIMPARISAATVSRLDQFIHRCWMMLLTPLAETIPHRRLQTGVICTQLAVSESPMKSLISSCSSPVTMPHLSPGPAIAWMAASYLDCFRSIEYVIRPIRRCCSRRFYPTHARPLCDPDPGRYGC